VTTKERIDRAERQVIDAIEAQFDIHAMDPEDFAEMWVAISKALTELASEPTTQKGSDNA
jgi:hypothetical protein